MKTRLLTARSMHWHCPSFSLAIQLERVLNSVGMRENTTLQNFTKWKLGNFTEFSWKEVQRKG